MTEEAINPFLDIAAPGMFGLKPYVPGKPMSELERELGIRDAVKLASNENPLGPSPRAREALSGVLDDLARYPDGGGFDLRRALAERHGVAPEAVTLGNGSNDVLDMVARAFLCPGTEAIFSEHAFAVYPICTQIVGATGQVAPAHDGSLGPQYGHDLTAMASLVGEDTRVVFIANPNNPTGTWVAVDELLGFLQELPDHVIAVVDEAYFEYVDEPEYPDATAWLDRLPNLVVTRTFSKAYGLAALRVGYALSHPDLAELLNRVRQPFNVSSAAQAAALAALDDAEHIRRSAALNRQGMAQLTGTFEELGLEYIPSVGNFVTVDLGRPAGDVDRALLREGVIARTVEGYGLPTHLRVTVGVPQENARFLAALRKVLGL
ncbi:MAG: histidinol-phosphate transaminase [Chromatiales bacterium]|jgi:histidinol-phosphate aminotransferase